MWGILPLLVVACMMTATIGCVRKPVDKSTLTVSIPPQKYLLEKIVGDKFEINTLLAPGSNPETYDPSMNHLMGLQNSCAYFRMGNIGFEDASLSKISNNFPDLKIINTSAGISVMRGSHGHHPRPGGKSVPNVDPHLWTSVRNAKIIASNMYEAMVRLDPANRNYYARRYESLQRELTELDDSIAKMLAPHKGESFVVWHPSLSYFARDYGLNQISIESEGKEVTPRQLKDRIDYAGSLHPKVFFIQKEYDGRHSRQISSQLGTRDVEISLMNYDWKKEMLGIARELSR